ncbi:hypothetical protein GCM10027290_31730 [Micromonospora sonneratiae]|uniref:Phosphotransferase enzyme family protein n=1 Tax=Micromonospora sonneratiae TaxID=1184706 RepID=A0ABW3YC25_9ACTN
MMLHTCWDALSEPVRVAVTEQTGNIRSASQVGAGSTCQLAEILHTRQGPIFCKGVRTDAGNTWMLRNEIRVNTLLPAGVAPRVLWQVEADGWLLAGFDLVPGRHADLSPGSPDLVTVADTLSLLSGFVPSAPVRPFSARWQGRIAPEVIDGEVLVHTDMSRRNWLVDGGRARLVDWSTPATGAAWIDTALMVMRLVRYGHSPAEAEAWASRVPAWSAAPKEAVAEFAVALHRLWRERQNAVPLGWRGPLVEATKAWATYRSRRATRVVLR